MAAPTRPAGDATRGVSQHAAAAVRTALPGDPDVDALGAMFGLLSDAGRLRLLTTLLHEGELCVGELAAAADMRESTVSHALRLLRIHRVVSVRRTGRHAYYRLQDGHVRALLETGLQHLAEPTESPVGIS